MLGVLNCIESDNPQTEKKLLAHVVGSLAGKTDNEIQKWQ